MRFLLNLPFKLVSDDNMKLIASYEENEEEEVLDLLNCSKVYQTLWN
jgi:hypothetical protein